jgi:FixJ family two-component response regulator
MKQVFKVGIIDDDSSKVTQIMIKLMEGFSQATYEKQNKYSMYQFNPIDLEIKDDLDEMIQQVINERLDCVLVDYKLSSYKNVDYSGVEFAKALDEALFDFPVFIITSYEDDLFVNEIFNAYQVFDFARYLNEESERIELNFKIIEQILKTTKQRKKWEDEIKVLLPLAGTSQEIDSKLLELDSKLERSINGINSISSKMKRELDSNKITELLKKIDVILDKE